MTGINVMKPLADIEIIDAHFHQWDPKNTPHALNPLAKLFGWNKGLYEKACNKVVPKEVADDLGTLKYMIHPYLPEDYQQDIKGHNVTSAVYTPYSWKVKSDLELAGETQFVEDLFARKSESVQVNLAAIVGNAHLENYGELQALLDSHKRASQRFVGIRDMIDWCDDPSVLTHARQKNITKNSAWLKGFEMLSRNNLFFDAFVYHDQLNVMGDLANQFPDTQLILSHMGIPIGAMGPFAGFGHNKAGQDLVIKQWQAGMAKLAENKNVVVKLSGLFMPVLGWGFHNRSNAPDLEEIVAKLQPLVDFTIEQFGVERCMFGSHFAPDKASISYSLMYDVYKEMVKNRPLEQQKMLFAENARGIYKIKS